MRKRPIVLGCDPAETHAGLGIFGDQALLHASLLPRGSACWEIFCVQFFDELRRLIHLHAVDVLAIEGFAWYGEHAKVEPFIRELTGIARLFSRDIPVREVTLGEWSAAITGTRPTKRQRFGTLNQSWKKTIRAGLTMRCRDMGIDLDAAVGADPGNHRVDALALALYTQDWLAIEQHMSR